MSMGWSAARKLRTALGNLARILAVELTCAAHGLDLRAPLQPGAGDGRGAGRGARAHRRARGRTAGSRPTWPRPRSWWRAARCAAAVEAAVGALA